MAAPINLACEESVHGFVQEMYSLSQGGRCRRCVRGEGGGTEGGRRSFPIRELHKRALSITDVSGPVSQAHFHATPSLRVLTHFDLCPPHLYYPFKNRCRPPQQQQAEDHEQELMTLVDICVDEICKNILLFEAPLPFDCLPPELVRRLVDSLTNHKALTKLTVSARCVCV